MTRPPRPLARTLTRRLLLISVVIVGLNIAFVGTYYGSDPRALEAYVVSDMTEALGASLVGTALPADAPARTLFADHPQAYAFALVDRSGDQLDAMNPALIPPWALDLHADDWITRLDAGPQPRLVAGHDVIGHPDGLRIVVAMTGDPANLLRRAVLDEFRQHVWLPILPMALILISAAALLIRRQLAPVARAAAWARAIRPGAIVPPPPAAIPAEVSDLVEATQRAFDRLNVALAAETRHAAEAAHALRTPVAVLVARLDALPPGETTDRLREDLAALSRTVQQVLSASRTDVLSSTVAPGLDLRRAAETVTAGLAPFAYGRGVELDLTVPDTPVHIRASGEGVELALCNLIENAVLHGGRGRVRIAVGPGPTVTIRDHGPGLPAGAAAQVFKPFWRGPAAAPGGTGLGLAIVDRLQRAQGGTVVLNAPPGGGCEVTLSWQAA